MFDNEGTEEVQPAEEEKQQEDSLRDDLAAAFDAAQTTEEPTTTEPAPEKASEDKVEEKLPPIEGNSEQKESVPAEASKETFSAPQHWSARDRDEFSKIPEEHRGLILRRHKEMEADYTRKTTEIAEVRKNWDAISREFEPFKQVLALNGTDEVSTIKRYIAIDKSLAENPTQTIKWLADQYKVNLGNFSQEQAQETYVDPDIQELRKQNQFLQQKIQQFEGFVHQTTTTPYVNEVKSFEEERDAQGNLKHPYFEDVRQDMKLLIETGRVTTLADAYEMATYANRSTREKLLQQQKRADLVKQQEADRARVSSAKRAASSVSSANNTVVKAKKDDLSLREMLEDTAVEMGFFS